MKRKKKDNKRIKIIAVILAVVLALFSVRVIDFGLISANKYSTLVGSNRVRKVAIKAPRGEILDTYGRAIATNRSGYDVVFNRAYMTSESTNETVKYIIEIFTKNQVSWNDILPLEKGGKYGFTEDEAEIKKLKKLIGVNTYATAENCFDQLVEKYLLHSYDKETQRLIMGVRYSMERADFSVANPFTFANDISSELMSVILELDIEKKGIDISVVPYRDYLDGEVATNIIGTVGKIEASEWESLKDKGYSYSDYVGKSGVEKLYEEYLKGEDGEITYILDNKGNIISSEITKSPRQGNTVVLTIDKRLQLASQQSYLDAIVECKKQFKAEVTGGSILAVDINTGGILVSASYPFYTMEDYKYNYDKLLNDSKKPLFDRSFNGTYAPGSIMKLAIGAAALEAGVVTPTEKIDCTRVYKKYDDYQPKCLHEHGELNIVEAIGQSCNYFFFEMAYRLGIESMNDYSRMLGLGEKTGIELDEKAGSLAGPEYSESVGELWTAGAALAAAIGQQNNAFTPIQILMYCSAFANGGIRYKTTILKEIRDYYTGEVVLANDPVVLGEANISESTMDVIREGMRNVVTEGTAGLYFENFPIDVAGKTGTAETSKGQDNALFCTYAPYDDPEIAVMVVMEDGLSSYSTFPVVQDMIKEYFLNSNDKFTPDAPNTVLP